MTVLTKIWFQSCWTIRGSNHGGGEILRNLPDRPRGQSSRLCNGYSVLFVGKATRGCVKHPTPTGAEVMNG